MSHVLLAYSLLSEDHILVCAHLLAIQRQEREDIYAFMHLFVNISSHTYITRDVRTMQTNI